MGLVELELTKRNNSLEAGLFFAHDALLGHLTTHESNLSLQRQIFRAEVVASQEGHTAENSAFSMMWIGSLPAGHSFITTAS